MCDISRQSLLLNFFPLRISIITKRYIVHWSCDVYCSGHKMFQTIILCCSWKRRRLEAILTINNQLYILSISFQKRAIRFNTLPRAQIFSIKQNNIVNWCKTIRNTQEKETDVKIDRIIPWTTLIEGLSDQFIGMISVSPIRPVLCLFVHPLLCMQPGARVS